MNRVVALALLAGMLALPQPVEAAKPPVEAFGRIAEISEVTLSPNGRLLAWVDHRGPRPSVLVLDLDARKPLAAFPVAERQKLRTIRFADDSTLLIELSMTQAITTGATRKHEWFRTMAVNVKTGESRILLLDDTGGELVTGASLLAARTTTPHTVIMARWNWEATAGRSATGTRIAGRRQDSNWVYSLFAVDTRTGRGSMLDQGTQFTDDWVLNSAGEPVVRSEWDPGKRAYSILARSGARWRAIHSQNERLSLAGLASDGNAVFALGSNGGGTSKLWSVPLDGSGAKVFLEDPARDVSHVSNDSLTGAPISVNFGGATPETHWLDEKAQARRKALVQAFPDRDVYIVGRSDDNQRVLALVESPSHPPMYYLVDFKTGNADIVGEAYSALANAKLGEVRAISYRARDGAQIPAYLTLPVDGGEKGLPLVVLPHGGPESRDYFEFDWWAQFLASRGYAVLQPQFRGSTGFGEAHRKAGYRQWGGMMQDDVTDGVRHLTEQGIVDAGRICIVGGSYGGYAALAGAAFTPDLYRCAASINGVTDLPLMIGYAETRGGDDSDAAYYWRDHIGDKTDPKVAARSPARAAEAIRVPVLLIHGVDDVVVPLQQAERMYQALTALKRPVKLVKLPGEDHWLSASETRIRVLAELESFLGEHLAAPAAATN